MDTIYELIGFLSKGSEGSPALQQAEEVVGETRLRVLSIKLLGWMKSQHRLGKIRPLTLNAEHEWCENLRQVMVQRLFADVFELQETQLILSTALGVDKQLALCALVDREYSPTLMT